MDFHLRFSGKAAMRYDEMDFHLRFPGKTEMEILLCISKEKTFVKSISYLGESSSIEPRALTSSYSF